jgi:hypothetical protein
VSACAVGEKPLAKGPQNSNCFPLIIINFAGFDEIGLRGEPVISYRRSSVWRGRLLQSTEANRSSTPGFIWRDGCDTKLGAPLPL